MAAAPSPAEVPTARPVAPRAPSRAAGERPVLRVVARPARRSKLLALTALLAVAGAFAVVALHALAAHASLEAEALEREVASLTDEADELAARVAALESPERVRAVAREELGMVPAEDARFVQVDPRADDLPARGVADRSAPAAGRVAGAEGTAGAEDSARTTDPRDG